MKVTKLERVEQEVTVDALCDRCGMSCYDSARYKEEVSPGNVLEYAIVLWDFGYHSRRDMDCGEAHVCETCFGELEKWLTARETRIASAGATED